MSIGWGIVSLGRHATNKMAPAINAASNSKLAAVYSRDMRIAEEFAERHAAGAAYDTLGALLNDSNVDAGTLSIQRSLQRVNGTFMFFPPKTAKSRRTIPMPPPVAAALHQHMKRQLEERAAVGEAWAGETWGALVFGDEIGKPLDGDYVRRRFYKLLQMAGLPQMRYHDLRHEPPL